MKCNAFQVTGLSILLGCLVATFLPTLSHCGGGYLKRAKIVSCASNLSQLYKLATIYSANHNGEWPTARGESFWLSLAKTTPPLIEADLLSILSCPLMDEECAPGECHYRGPRLPWTQLKPTDPIAADNIGNHGDGYGVLVLLKNGNVLEIGPDNPLWKKCEELLWP